MLFSSGMRNPCVTFAGPFILFWLVLVQLSACEPTDWGLLACVHVDEDVDGTLGGMCKPPRALDVVEA